MFYHLVDDEVQLKLLETRDAESMFRLIDASRAYLQEWMPWAAGTKTPDNSRMFIESTLQQFAANHGFQAGILYQGELTGVIGFHEVNWEHRQVSLGYWLGETFQGKGLVTRACREMVEIAFSVYGLNRVEIRAGVENLKSRAIPERLGFVQEGVCRQAERNGDRYIDQVVYSMLAAQWVRG